MRDILGQDGPGADYAALPWVTFTEPEIGTVGLTEQRAREAGVRVAPAPRRSRPRRAVEDALRELSG